MSNLVLIDDAKASMMHIYPKAGAGWITIGFPMGIRPFRQGDAAFAVWTGDGDEMQIGSTAVTWIHKD